MGGLKKCVADAQNKRRPGRPSKEIDWKMVDEFLLCGSPGTEIASLFDMHEETFYVKFQQHYKQGFTGYCQEKRFKGDALLRRQQFLKALGKSTDGDNTMLVWLGKNRLNQKENPDQETTAQVTETLKNAMDLIDALQKKEPQSNAMDLIDALQKKEPQSSESNLINDESIISSDT